MTRPLRFLARLVGWTGVVLACTVAGVAVAGILAAGALIEWGER